MSKQSRYFGKTAGTISGILVTSSDSCALVDCKLRTVCCRTLDASNLKCRSRGDSVGDVAVPSRSGMRRGENVESTASLREPGGCRKEGKKASKAPKSGSKWAAIEDMAAHFRKMFLSWVGCFHLVLLVKIYMLPNLHIWKFCREESLPITIL